ncbi:MAG: hypothetical protein J6J31_00140 [Thermoguttaceae bacterium]|nr:hypothetical protein [Thermoguttaceae bacterium]
MPKPFKRASAPGRRNRSSLAAPFSECTSALLERASAPERRNRGSMAAPFSECAPRFLNALPRQDVETAARWPLRFQNALRAS